MKQIYCLGCRTWFDHLLSSCPECDWVRPGFNKWLRTAQLNNHLYAQAASAERERGVERRLARG